MREADQILHALKRWQQNCVLATIVKVEGSSYRKPGAMMLIGEQGSVAGAVSGGCIEKEIAARASQVFEKKKSQFMQYDGRYVLGCNGTLHILLEFIPFVDENPVFSNYLTAFAQRKSWTIITGFQESVGRSFAVFEDNHILALDATALPSSIHKGSLANLTELNSNTLYQDDLLYRKINAAPHLVIIGNEMDSLKLAALALPLDYAITIVTHPRNPNLDNAPDGIQLVTIAPEELSKTLNFDAQTAVVLMTHSYSRDMAYLRNLLTIPEVAYMGMIGPKERGDDILMELAESGLSLPGWLESSFKTPAGLDIGGEMPAEVALSVLAQIQASFTGHSGHSLHDKQSGIHDKE